MWLMSKCEDCESVERTEDGSVLKEASRGCTDVVRHGDAGVNEGQGGRVDTGLEDAWMDELCDEWRYLRRFAKLAGRCRSACEKRVASALWVRMFA